MVYENSKEMNLVLGKLEENSFIKQEIKGLEEFKKQAKALVKILSN